jgi:uncharacterized membrane protein YGL010W
MQTLADHLARYATYHRDRRNIATHLLGVPIIVLAVVLLLSRPTLATVLQTPITPALLASLATVAWYVSLDRSLGVLMAVVLAAMLAVAAPLAAASTGVWLGWGLGLFVVGWVVQFLGHWFEGRKPAFTDDLRSLLVGPLFVAAELLFLMGLRRELQAQVERRAGPTRTRRRDGATA